MFLSSTTCVGMQYKLQYCKYIYKLLVVSVHLLRNIARWYLNAC